MRATRSLSTRTATGRSGHSCFDGYAGVDFDFDDVTVDIVVAATARDGVRWSPPIWYDDGIPVVDRPTIL